MWIIQFLLFTEEKERKTGDFCSGKRKYSHKIKELSTTYQQNVDNYVQNIVIHCVWLWIRYFFKKNQDLLDFNGLFQYNRGDVLWTDENTE